MPLTEEEKEQNLKRAAYVSELKTIYENNSVKDFTDAILRRHRDE